MHFSFKLKFEDRYKNSFFSLPNFSLSDMFEFKIRGRGS